MYSIQNRKMPVGKYAGWALIFLSIIGLYNGFTQKYYYSITLIEVVVPYLIALSLGILRVAGYKQTIIPIIALSSAGFLLNLAETIQGPNQKDIAEVILFVLVVILALIDRFSANNKNS